MRKPKIGEYIKVNGVPELVGKEVKVAACALGSVWVKPKYAREDIEVPIDLIEFIEPEKLGGHEKNELIKKWVDEKNIESQSLFNNEKRFLNLLIEKYPNLQFWRNFDPGFKVKSLIWWLAGGKMDIQKFYNYYCVDINVSTNNNLHLENQKIGEDIEIKTKPKNFLDLK